MFPQPIVHHKVVRQSQTVRLHGMARTIVEVTNSMLKEIRNSTRHWKKKKKKEKEGEVGKKNKKKL